MFRQDEAERLSGVEVSPGGGGALGTFPPVKFLSVPVPTPASAEAPLAAVVTGSPVNVAHRTAIMTIKRIEITEQILKRLQK